MKPRPIHYILFVVTIVAFTVGIAGVVHLADIGHGRIQPADIQRIVQDIDDDNTTVVVQIATGLGIRQTATATVTDAPNAPAATNNGILALATILCCLLILAAAAIAIRLPR